MTYRGHQFLDAARNNSIWEKAKTAENLVAGHFGSRSIILRVDDTLRPPSNKIVTERRVTARTSCRVLVVYCNGNEMDSKQFAELHAKCWETLKHYVHEADRMCELFGQCLPEPSAIQIRSDIVEQRVREHNAYASYTEIRRQLLEAVRIGYDPSN